MALVRATVGGKITAALINAIIDRLELGGKHAEFTVTSASSASATNTTPGIMNYDVAASNDAVFVTASPTATPSTITFNEAGIYAIDWNGTIPVTPTGLFYLRIDIAGIVLSQTSVNAINVIGGSMVSSFWCPAGTVATFTWLHTSAASRVLTSRVKVTKLA